jgi:hypothetical protein
VSDDGIRVSSMDHGMTTFLEVWMKRGMFGRYELSEPSSYYFDSVIMLKVMRVLDGDVTCVINGPLEFTVSGKSTQKKFVVNQVSKVDREPADVDSIAKSFEVSVDVPMGVIAEVMKNITDLGGDDVFFRWSLTDGVGSMSMDSRRDVMASYSVKLNDLSIMKMVGSGQVGFKLHVLQHIVQSRFGMVRLDMMSSNSPMFIIADSDNYHARFIVAPFVPESSDEG